MKSTPLKGVLKNDVPEKREFDRLISLNLQFVNSASINSESFILTESNTDLLKTEYEHKQLQKEVNFNIESENAEPISLDDFIVTFPKKASENMEFDILQFLNTTSEKDVLLKSQLKSLQLSKTTVLKLR